MIVVAPATPVNSPLTVAPAANAPQVLPVQPASRARTEPLAQTDLAGPNVRLVLTAPAVLTAQPSGAVFPSVPKDLCDPALLRDLENRDRGQPVPLIDRVPPIDRAALDRNRPSPATRPPPLGNVCRKSWPLPD